MEDAVKMAGFTGAKIVGDMHAFRATDPREKDIAEGHNPIQVSRSLLNTLKCSRLFLNVEYKTIMIYLSITTIQIILDQAAHLMDAVAMGK